MAHEIVDLAQHRSLINNKKKAFRSHVQRIGQRMDAILFSTLCEILRVK